MDECKPVGAGSAGGGGGAGGMAAETRTLLDEFYRPQREALVAMFRDESLRWGRP